MEIQKHAPEADEQNLREFLRELIDQLPYQPANRDEDEPVIMNAEIIGDTSFIYSVSASQEDEDRWSVIVAYSRESADYSEEDVKYQSLHSYYEFSIVEYGEGLALETSYSQLNDREYRNGNATRSRIDTVISDERLAELYMMLASGRFNLTETQIKKE